jgi:hypothetical protein
VHWPINRTRYCDFLSYAALPFNAMTLQDLKISAVPS